MNHLIFNAQLFFSTVVLSFSMYMLYRGESSGSYLPIITGVIGSWLPTPMNFSINKDVNKENQTSTQSDLESILIHH